MVHITGFFALYVIGIFLLNHYEGFDASAFVVAALIGLYDGAMSNYIWSILVTEFENKFLALALSSAVFMIYLFIITFANSVMLTTTSFDIYFVFQTVITLSSLVIFAYVFQPASLRPAEQIVNNELRRISTKAMGKPIGGMKEITDADVKKEKDKVAEVKRRSSLKAVVVERKQSLRKSNTPHEALPEFNINNSNKEESDGDIDDMELEEQNGIINTQSTGGGSNHHLKFDAGE